jgi:hypothetical protein
MSRSGGGRCKSNIRTSFVSYAYHASTVRCLKHISSVILRFPYPENKKNTENKDIRTCVRVRVFVCVCVCEREREREHVSPATGMPNRRLMES